MKSLTSIVLALLLIACTPEQAKTERAAAPAPSGCSAKVENDWTPTGTTETMKVAAEVAGVDCASASVSLTVTRADGGEGLTFIAPLSQMPIIFAPEGKPLEGPALQTALQDWVKQDPGSASGSLPEWPKGADQPMQGEFPFYPEQGIERDMYEKTRAANLGTFCFVQGMESVGCYVVEPQGPLRKIGAQSLPG